MPQQSSMALAMKSFFNMDQFNKRQKHLLNLLPEQDIFLHLRQISLWIDPLDATQEFSGTMIHHLVVILVFVIII